MAEGVETQEELQALQDMGCKYIQGYLFSTPFPAEALADQPLCAAMKRSILIPNRTCRVV
ncbi:MAG: EAL domain-containing protein [Janthinobacterium lividum]